MDRSGAMPRSAWIEVRDPNGALLVEIPAQIDGGTVSAELPAFPPNTLGSIQLCCDDGYRDEVEIEPLPTKRLVMVVEMG